MQLYRDLRILTARPSPEDEAASEHRLYGVADAADAWSVGRWARAAAATLETLAAEGRPAIVVGGTGLYFAALTRGLADMPAVPESVREAVSSDYDRSGEAAFRGRLRAVDPAAESRIAPGDRQRLVRALAVHAASGRALSDWRADTRPIIDPEDYEAVVLDPPRTELYARCDQRVREMLRQGVLDEVGALRDRGLDASLPALKAVGFREFAACVAGEVSLETAVAAVGQATRNYAKRQLTWFRNQTPQWPRH